MIRYDRSPHSVLVMCTCGFREMALTKQGAWRVAAWHEEIAHPGRYQVRHAETMRQQRRRDQTDNPDDDPGM